MDAFEGGDFDQRAQVPKRAVERLSCQRRDARDVGVVETRLVERGPVAQRLKGLPVLGSHSPQGSAKPICIEHILCGWAFARSRGRDPHGCHCEQQQHQSEQLCSRNARSQLLNPLFDFGEGRVCRAR